MSVSSIPHIPRQTMQQLDCLRLTASAFMIASLVALVATAVLVGFSQARYLSPATPLYSLGGFVVLLIVTIAIDCTLRSIALKNKINPADYFRIRQPMPPPPPKKPKEKNP